MYQSRQHKLRVLLTMIHYGYKVSAATLEKSLEKLTHFEYTALVHKNIAHHKTLEFDKGERAPLDSQLSPQTA